LSSAQEFSDEQDRQIAALIREEIARRRMSRQQLADKARLSLSTLEKVLGGRRPLTLATADRRGLRPDRGGRRARRALPRAFAAGHERSVRNVPAVSRLDFTRR
jgi:hypothetical protein